MNGITGCIGLFFAATVFTCVTHDKDIVYYTNVTGTLDIDVSCTKNIVITYSNITAINITKSLNLTLLHKIYFLKTASVNCHALYMLNSSNILTNLEKPCFPLLPLEPITKHVKTGDNNKFLSFISIVLLPILLVAYRGYKKFTRINSVQDLSEMEMTQL